MQVAAMIIVAIFFDFFLIDIQKKSYESAITAHGLALVRLLSQTVQLGVFVENEADLITPAEMILSQDDVVEVGIFNGEGHLLHKNKKEGYRDQLNEVPPDLPLMPGNIDNSEYMYRQTPESFIFWWPVFFHAPAASEESLYFEMAEDEAYSEMIGYATMVLSKEKYQEGVKKILVRTGLIVCSFLLLGIVGTFIMIHGVTRPLRHLMVTVRKTAAKSEEHDDIRMLAETYTTLIHDLEQSFLTIKELKDGLEEKVDERTRELAVRQFKLEMTNEKLSGTLSELQRTQEQLVHSEKMAAMGQLIAGVAHEINNTVNFISGALPSFRRTATEIKQLLTLYDERDRARTEAEVKEIEEKLEKFKKDIEYDELFETVDYLLTNMEEGAIRTTGIVQDLKAFSREEKEKMVLGDVNAILDTTLHFVDKEEMGEVAIIKEYGEIEPFLCLPGRLSQVFLNILNNGMQAMEGKGTMTISSWQAGRKVHVRFTDTGCGIPKEIMSKIFDPFFTSKEVGKGTGLGLGISYSIVKEHNGEIKVTSEPGLGAEFEIIIPIQKTNEKTGSAGQGA